MTSNDSDRREAERLVDLDDRGRRIEAVAAVLAVRRMAKESADELAELDRVALNEISTGEHIRTGGNGTLTGPEYVP